MQWKEVNLCTKEFIMNKSEKYVLKISQYLQHSLMKTKLHNLFVVNASNNDLCNYCHKVRLGCHTGCFIMMLIKYELIAQAGKHPWI